MIREAKIEDLPAILSIYNDAILHTTSFTHTMFKL